MSPNLNEAEPYLSDNISFNRGDLSSNIVIFVHPEMRRKLAAAAATAAAAAESQGSDFLERGRNQIYRWI